MMDRIARGLDSEIQVSPIGVVGGELIISQAVPIPVWTVAEDQLDPAVVGSIDSRIGTWVQLDVEADVSIERLGIDAAAESECNDRLAVTGWPVREVVDDAQRPGAGSATACIQGVKRNRCRVRPALPRPGCGIGIYIEVGDDDLACSCACRAQHESCQHG